MGREVKRVSLDFNWPLNKVWSGYVNPNYKPCPHCHAGYSKTYDLISEHINKLMWDIQALKDPNYAKITTWLCGREPQMFLLGHDSTDAWAAVKKLADLAGLPEKWDECSHCNGDGIAPEAKEAYENWKKTEPPSGDGWQVWETVSEGSPISPVFSSEDELIQWLVNKGYSEKAVRNFVKTGWVPSMVLVDGELLNDIESARLQ